MFRIVLTLPDGSQRVSPSLATLQEARRVAARSARRNRYADVDIECVYDGVWVSYACLN